MYVTSLSNGALYRITTAASPGALPDGLAAVPEPPPLVLMMLLGALVMRRNPKRKPEG